MNIDSKNAFNTLSLLTQSLRAQVGVLNDTKIRINDSYLTDTTSDI